MKRTSGKLATWLMAALMCSGVCGAAAWGAPQPGSPPGLDPGDQGGVSYSLFSEAQQSSGLRGNDMTRVVMQLEDVPTARQLDKLASIGVKVRTQAGNWLDVNLPLASLKIIAAKQGEFSFIRTVTQPGKPDLQPVKPSAARRSDRSSAAQADSAAPTGTQANRAESYHAQGYTGRGVKIALMDFGFNVDESNPRINGQPVHAVNLKYNEDITENSDHGTGCAQIIMDIAPGADVTLIAVDGLVSYRKAIAWAREHHMDIMSSSISWGGPLDYGDGSNALARDADQAVASGVAIFQSAGNDAENFLFADWSDPDGNGLYNFSQDREGEALFLPAGDNVSYDFTLYWNDFAANTGEDLDLFLLDHNGNIVSYSADRQSLRAYPSKDEMQFSPETSGIYYLVIQNANSRVRPGAFKLLLSRSLSGEVPFVNPSGSVWNGMAGARTVATVGAVDPSTNEVQTYSNRGPTADGRIKPDIAAYDALYCEAYPDGFYGTSCSTPAAAALAALVKQAHPELAGKSLIAHLKQRAKVLAGPSPNDDYGWGLLDLSSAMARINRAMGTR